MNSMDICHSVLWLVSTALILAGIGVMLLVLKDRGLSSGTEIGNTYNEGKVDLLWTISPLILVVLLVVAVVINNRC